MSLPGHVGPDSRYHQLWLMAAINLFSQATGDHLHHVPYSGLQDFQFLLGMVVVFN